MVEELERKPVLSKKDFVERYRRGEFGNASPTWDTRGEFLATYPNHLAVAYGQLFHVRCRRAGGPTFYDLTYEKTLEKMSLLGREGLSEDFYISAMAPTERTVIQGEVERTERGLYLSYSRVRKPMREALAEEHKMAYRTEALLLLRGAMDGNSWEWLNFLLEAYIGHVVEFSTYEVEWGTLPRFNTVFWEVRYY